MRWANHKWAKLDAVQKRQVVFHTGSSLVVCLIRTVFLICMCFVVLYPLLYMFSVSFRMPSDLYDPTVIWIPKNWTTDNYTEVIETMNYLPTLLSTFLMSSVSTALSVASCAVVGYGFARFQFPGRKLLFGLVIFTIIVPAQNISIPLFVQYKDFDFLWLGQIGRLFTGEPFTVSLLDSPLVLYLPAALGVGIRSGLFIYIFRQFFRGMPKELEEAAYIDGCGALRTFLKIMLVNAGPAILSCTLFSFVWYWNDYFFTAMFFSEPSTLTTMLSSLADMLRSAGKDFYSNPYIIVAQMQAASLLVIAPLILLYVFLQRFFTESIDRSGIVG